ncbi:MAG: hypothetical protein ACOX6O_06070 [Christensenellales bacterium]
MMKRIIGLFLVFLVMAFSSALSEDTPAQPVEQPLFSEQADMGALGIDGDHRFTRATLESIIASIESKETFLVFFGYHSCAWCRSIAPILHDVSQENQIEIRFVDIMDDANRYKEDMLTLDAYLEGFTLNYQGRIGVNTPRVSAIKNGQEIAMHVGTFPEHDPYTQKLSTEQTQKLHSIFMEMVVALEN